MVVSSPLPSAFVSFSFHFLSSLYSQVADFVRSLTGWAGWAGWTGHNRLFIHRGLEYERAGTFTQRLQTEFLTANILKKNTQPGDVILTSEGQYIQICNVKPVAEDHPLRRWLRSTRNPCQRRAPFAVHKGLVVRENEFP